MKALYFITCLLKWPFLAVGGVFNGIGWLFCWLGFWVHDNTEGRVWTVLHRRACAKK